MRLSLRIPFVKIKKILHSIRPEGEFVTINKSINLKVNGMHCGGCAGKIKKSLESMNIEHNVDINVESGLVKIKFNSEQSTIAALKGSVEQAGFQVESVEFD